jgi:hypothetical protein
MYSVEAWRDGEWREDPQGFETAAEAEMAAETLAVTGRVSTRVRCRTVGWASFEILPGGISLTHAVERAMPEIHRLVREWCPVRWAGSDIDLHVNELLRVLSRQLLEAPMDDGQTEASLVQPNRATFVGAGLSRQAVRVDRSAAEIAQMCRELLTHVEELMMCAEYRAKEGK